MSQTIRQYIGARYTPKFMDDYDPSQEYEALSVVDNGMGTSYICGKTTPAGTPLTDTDYWHVYGASSGAIINLQNQIDVIDGRLDVLDDIWYTPEMFGAAGDGVEDDTAAVQAAFNAGKNILLSQTYRIIDTLFIDGVHHVLGNGTLIAALPVSPNTYLIVLGATALGVAGEVFKGVIEDITIVGSTGTYNYVLAGCNCQDVTINNLIFDFSQGGNVINKVIMFGNNHAVAPNNSDNRNYYINNCQVIMDSNPSSGINPCETLGVELRNHVIVSNNDFIYSKDDVGFHGCKDINIYSNYIHSFSGRIFVSNSKGVNINNNRIYVEPNIHCQGIQVTPESGYADTDVEDVNICNNIVDYRGTNDNVTQYGIRVTDVKHGLISGNRLLTDQMAQGRICIENHAVDGITRVVEGIEICDNQCTGIYHALGGVSFSTLTENNFIHDNIIKFMLQATSYSDYTYGNILLRNSNFDEYTYANTKPLNEYLLPLKATFSGAPTNTEQFMLFDGFPSYTISSPSYLNVVFRDSLEPNTVLTGSDKYTFTIYKNGNVLATINKTASSLDYMSLTYANRYLEPGDVITVSYKITGTVPATPPTLTQLGLELVNLRDC